MIKSCKDKMAPRVMGDTKGSPSTWFSGDFSGREASDDFKTVAAAARSADRTSCSADSFTAPWVFPPRVSLVDDSASAAYKTGQINLKKKRLFFSFFQIHANMYVQKQISSIRSKFKTKRTLERLPLGRGDDEGEERGRLEEEELRLVSTMSRLDPHTELHK